MATRVSKRERVLIDTAAELEGLSMTDLLREIVLPAAAARVAQHAQQLSGSVAGAAQAA